MSGEKFKIGVWLKAGSRRESYERLGFLLMFVAVGLVWLGMLLGSFVRYTVYLAAFGALLLLPAIVLYIASQLMEGNRNETAAVSKQ